MIRLDLSMYFDIYKLYIINQLFKLRRFLNYHVTYNKSAKSHDVTSALEKIHDKMTVFSSFIGFSDSALFICITEVTTLHYLSLEFYSCPNNNKHFCFSKLKDRINKNELWKNSRIAYGYINVR